MFRKPFAKFCHRISLTFFSVSMSLARAWTTRTCCDASWLVIFSFLFASLGSVTLAKKIRLWQLSQSKIPYIRTKPSPSGPEIPYLRTGIWSFLGPKIPYFPDRPMWELSGAFWYSRRNQTTSNFRATTYFARRWGAVYKIKVQISCMGWQSPCAQTMRLNSYWIILTPHPTPG